MRALLTTIILAALLGGGGVYTWQYFGGFTHEQGTALTFIEAYGDYADVARRVEVLVHLPGTETNRDRAELHSLLETILTQMITVERREELARLAFSNLDALRNEVDAAQSAQAKLYEALQKLDDASRSFQSLDLERRAQHVVMHARKRAELSARITAVLSETNEHTYSIITRLLEEGGELTGTHIQALNAQLDEAETRHESLERLYQSHQEQTRLLEEEFQELAHTAL